jgi:photosystem II stability/assembly factor-like uncharacterized protein
MPTAPHRLLLGTRNGVLALSLTQEGWDTGAVLWRDRPVSAIAVDPAAPDRIHVSVYDDGVYRSEDGGRTWERYLWAELHALAVRPDHPELVYAGGEPAEVYRSTDSGSYWTPLRLAGGREGAAATDPAWRRVRSLAFDPAATSTVYAAVEGVGILVTFDGGREWTALAAKGLPAEVRVLWIGPEERPALWAGTAAGLWRSDDQGFGWADAGVGIGDPEVLALAGTADALLAAGHPRALVDWWDTAPARLYRRGAGSARWWPVTEPLDGAVYGFAGRHGHPAVYAGTTGGTVLVSRDAGASWSALARGLPPIRTMALD